MSFFEPMTRATEPRHWLGDMEADHYIYSAGIAGQAFFAALRGGKILGATCAPCDVTYVPARMYCERCFAELSNFSDVGLRGTVRSFTVARVDKAGRALDSPTIFAVIGLGSNATGLLHRLGQVEPRHVRVGMTVEAVLKPRAAREGRITDILHFQPV